MSEYNVIIEETVTQTFSVEAESEQEALEKTIQNYKSGEFVLEPGELQSAKCILADKLDGKWEEIY
jgi:hypothetical protein